MVCCGSNFRWVWLCCIVFSIFLFLVFSYFSLMFGKCCLKCCNR